MNLWINNKSYTDLFHRSAKDRESLVFSPYTGHIFIKGDAGVLCLVLKDHSLPGYGTKFLPGYSCGQEQSFFQSPVIQGQISESDIFYKLRYYFEDQTR